MNGIRFSDPVNSVITRMREMLFGSEVSQSSHAGPGHAAVVREGTICMFDDKQQEYGIMWQEANQVDQDMTFVSLAMLLFFLVDPGKKRIVRSMQELIRRSNSNVFNRTTSPENVSTENPKKKQKKSPVLSQPPSQKRGLTESDETVHQPTAKKSRKPPKKSPTKTPKTSPKPSPTKTAKSVKQKNQTIKFQTKSNGPQDDCTPNNLEKTHSRGGQGAKKTVKNKLAKKKNATPVVPTLPTTTTLSPEEQRENSIFQHSMRNGAIRVITGHSVSSDPFPLGAYNGVSPGGYFEFHTGPDTPVAYLTRAHVSDFL